MDRWSGLLRVALPSAVGVAATSANPQFKVAASLCLSPSFESLAVPSANAVFFHGDRVDGTGNPVIEEMSDPRNVVELLVSKLGRSVNAWVVEASTFVGPFALYREFVPSVDRLGNPRRYDPDGFPASSSIAALLSSCVTQAKDIIAKQLAEYKSDNASSTPSASCMPDNVCSRQSASRLPPKTIILGFSKGGVVVNQLLSELAHSKSEVRGVISNTEKSSINPTQMTECILPGSKDSFLCSISDFHYVDVGLNTSGAYITSHDVIRKIAACASLGSSGIRVVLHGTPRQWCDNSRPWIREEKDKLKQMLEGEASRCSGRLEITERLYFAGKPPSLQMHFEIIKVLTIS